MLSFICYRLFLNKETFFRINRLAIIFMISCSLLFPLIEIPQELSFRKGSRNFIEFATPEGLFAVDYTQNSKEDSNKKVEKQQHPIIENKSGWEFIEAFFWTYFSGVIVFAITFLIQLYQLKIKSKKLERIKDGQFTIYELTGNQPPFSFYKHIYLNPSLYDPETYNQIIAHEKVHILKKHYLDKLLGELLVICFWFNPICWFLRKDIGNNLEYQTDDEILASGINEESYQMSLLRVSVRQHPLSFTNNYNQSFLEKRIEMMKARKSSVKSTWKYLMILPLFSLTLLSFNATDCTDCNDDILLKERYEYSYDHIEEVNIETTFKSLSEQNTLYVANVSGKVLVTGQDQNAIEVIAFKKIHATNNDQLEIGVSDIKISRHIEDHRLSLFLESPYSKFDPETYDFSYSDNCDNNPCFEYDFLIDYQIKVPKNTSIVIQNINKGDVEVRNITGSYININHITGSIVLLDVASDCKLETITGNITASFDATPAGTSSFKTVSGFIEASYPKNFSGQIEQIAGNGKFISDYPIASQFLKNNLVSRRFALGDSDASFRFETTSGDIRLKSN
ncbi:MAG: M56 family metallopeptidase [Bacteroidota bacterium]